MKLGQELMSPIRNTVINLVLCFFPTMCLLCGFDGKL